MKTEFATEVSKSNKVRRNKMKMFFYYIVIFLISLVVIILPSTFAFSGFILHDLIGRVDCMLLSYKDNLRKRESKDLIEMIFYVLQDLSPSTRQGSFDDLMNSYKIIRLNHMQAESIYISPFWFYWTEFKVSNIYLFSQNDIIMGNSSKLCDLTTNNNGKRKSMFYHARNTWSFLFYLLSRAITRSSHRNITFETLQKRENEFKQRLPMEDILYFKHTDNIDRMKSRSKEDIEDLPIMELKNLTFRWNSWYHPVMDVEVQNMTVHMVYNTNNNKITFGTNSDSFIPEEILKFMPPPPTEEGIYPKIGTINIRDIQIQFHFLTVYNDDKDTNQEPNTEELQTTVYTVSNSERNRISYVLNTEEIDGQDICYSLKSCKALFSTEYPENEVEEYHDNDEGCISLNQCFDLLAKRSPFYKASKDSVIDSSSLVCENNDKKVVITPVRTIHIPNSIFKPLLDITQENKMNQGGTDQVHFEAIVRQSAVFGMWNLFPSLDSNTSHNTRSSLGHHEILNHFDNMMKSTSAWIQQQKDTLSKEWNSFLQSNIIDIHNEKQQQRRQRRLQLMETFLSSNSDIFERMKDQYSSFTESLRLQHIHPPPILQLKRFLQQESERMQQQQRLKWEALNNHKVKRVLKEDSKHGSENFDRSKNNNENDSFHPRPPHHLLFIQHAQKKIHDRWDKFRRNVLDKT